ncbi:uncharacterized protein EDB93DRAFT_1333950 [Suillus bovinus]|uniref:uncharacterized protein n=1 Tax=Suillus bovinus TaxID=48563 RepID=UPI001B863B6D|nr:uncharacterized protein EDB93DRAFT_1333950 [Suillus bovinus]KAG2160119.1 hypothetical protein EDB93DRAFT_1333950 [Suillus bovinus]
MRLSLVLTVVAALTACVYASDAEAEGSSRSNIARELLVGCTILPAWVFKDFSGCNINSRYQGLIDVDFHVFAMDQAVFSMNFLSQHGSLDDQIYFTVAAASQNGTTKTTTSIDESPLPTTA